MQSLWMVSTLYSIFSNFFFDSVRVYLWNFPSTSIIYHENSQLFQFTTLSNFIALLTSHHICLPIPIPIPIGKNLDNAIKYSFIQHNTKFIYHHHLKFTFRLFKLIFFAPVIFVIFFILFTLFTINKKRN